jgi:O-antigen ligase
MARRLGTVFGKALLAVALLAVAAFVLVISFANYPWFALAVVLVTLLLIGASERGRRRNRQARDDARRRSRRFYG